MKEFLLVFIGFVIGVLFSCLLFNFGDMSFEQYKNKLNAITNACKIVNSKPVTFEHSGVVRCKNEAIMKWSVK